MTNVSTPIEITTAREATDELVAAFARLIPQLSSSAVPLNRQALAEIVASPCTTILLARDTANDGRIVGTLTLAIFRIPTAVRAWIEDVVVADDARGRGIGELLTREAVRVAEARGAQTVDLTSRPSREPARRLYEKVGFRVRDTNVFRYVPASNGSNR